MARQTKARPELPPDGEPLQGVLRRALRDEQVRRGVTIARQVRGGVATQAYSFDFRAAGDGTARAELSDALRRRKAGTGAATVGDRDFARLLRRIVSSGVLELPEEPPRFLPDTLVGVLEVSDGRSTYRRYFAADPDQAAVQGKSPPPELVRAIDPIYALGAALTKNRSVRP
jgi:hypothetical protein